MGRPRVYRRTMAGTGSHRLVTGWKRLWTDCGLVRYRIPLTAIALGCIGFGILVAVLVPDSGPAWAMSVAGCLAAGVLLLARLAVGLVRAGRRATF